MCVFFCCKQKAAYGVLRSLVGSEMCIRDRLKATQQGQHTLNAARSGVVAGPDGPVTMSRGFHAFFRQYYNLRSLLRRADPGLTRLIPIPDYPLQLAPEPGGRPVVDSFTHIPRVPPWNLVGFVAQMIDGALGMAYGVSSNTFLLSMGVPPAIASASVHIAEMFTTGISGLSHFRLGNVDAEVFKRLIVPGVLGGVAALDLLDTHGAVGERTEANGEIAVRIGWRDGREVEQRIALEMDLMRRGGKTVISRMSQQVRN